MDNVGATSVRVQWNTPSVVGFPISYYLVTARSLNSSSRVLIANTSTNVTTFNVTGLLPGTTYELTVVAVSQGGEVFAESQVSDSLPLTTKVTGK